MTRGVDAFWSRGASKPLTDIQSNDQHDGKGLINTLTVQLFESTDTRIKYVRLIPLVLFPFRTRIVQIEEALRSRPASQVNKY